MPTIEELRKLRTPVAATSVAETGTIGQDTDAFTPPENHYDTPEWEAARTNPQLIGTIRRYAKNVANEDFSSDDQAFDWYISDRRWKDSNLLSSLKELNFVKGGFGAKYASEQDLADLSYLRGEWDKLPGGFSRIADGDIAEGTGAIIENIAKGAVDPSILLGGFAGKGAGVLVNKAAGEATKQAVKRAAQVGASVATDAALSGAANVAYQEVNKEVGLQEEVDGWDALKAGTLGAVLSAPGAYMAFRPKAGQIINDPTKAAEQAIRADADLTASGDTSKSMFGGSQKVTPDGHKLTTDDIDLGKEMQNPPIPKPDAEPSFVDLGYDVENLANITKENAALARALADTVPGWNTSKNVFEWLGTNSDRVMQFKAKHFPKIDDEKDFERMTVALQEEFPELFTEARRGKVTDAQARQEATALMKDKSGDQLVEGLINTPTGYAANVGEQNAARFIVNMLHDDVYNTAQRALKDPNWNPTAQELSEAERKWELLGLATARYAGFRSEAGRALRMPEADKGWFNRGLEKTSKVANMITSTNLSDEARKNLLKDLGKALSMLDRGNQRQLDLFVANMHQNKGNWGDVFYEMYYNWGLLSNPSTQGINLLGNLTTTAIDNVERGIAAGLTTGERLPFLNRMAGYATALPDAFKTAWKTYKTELPTDPQTRLENMDKHAIPSWRITKDGFKKAGVGEQGVVIGGRQARIPGRMLLGMDEFMKVLHQRAYIYEAASRAAGDTKGTARKQAMEKFLNAIPQETLDGALNESRRLTYTDKLGPGLRGFQQFVDDLPGGRIIIPFIRTPAKIIQQAFDMLGPTERTAGDFAAGGFDRKRAMARVAMGYSLLGTGAIMAYQGLATGPSPSDAGARSAFETNGMLPWAVRSGDSWIQINRFDPVAIPFTFGAGLEKTLESFAASGTGAEREEGYLATMASLLSDALLDKSFFQGIENVTGAIMEPERRLETFGKGVVRSFIPAIAAGYARASDPRTTAPVTFMEVIQDRIGFDERKKVPTKVDGFGREVWNEVPGSMKGEDSALDFINRFVNPFKAKSGANDPISNELHELGIKLTPTRRKYKDIELDSNQQYILNKAAGQTLYNSLKFAHSQPNWDKLPKEAKRSIIEEYKTFSNRMGETMLIGVYPELARRGILESSEQKKLKAPTKSDIKEFLKPSFQR